MNVMPIGTLSWSTGKKRAQKDSAWSLPKARKVEPKIILID